MPPKRFCAALATVVLGASVALAQPVPNPLANVIAKVSIPAGAYPETALAHLCSSETLDLIALRTTSTESVLHVFCRILHYDARIDAPDAVNDFAVAPPGAAGTSGWYTVNAGGLFFNVVNPILPNLPLPPTLITTTLVSNAAGFLDAKEVQVRDLSGGDLLIGAVDAGGQTIHQTKKVNGSYVAAPSIAIGAAIVDFRYADLDANGEIEVATMTHTSVVFNSAATGAPLGTTVQLASGAGGVTVTKTPNGVEQFIVVEQGGAGRVFGGASAAQVTGFNLGMTNVGQIKTAEYNGAPGEELFLYDAPQHAIAVYVYQGPARPYSNALRSSHVLGVPGVMPWPRSIPAIGDLNNDGDNDWIFCAEVGSKMQFADSRLVAGADAHHPTLAWDVNTDEIVMTFPRINTLAGQTFNYLHTERRSAPAPAGLCDPDLKQSHWLSVPNAVSTQYRFYIPQNERTHVHFFVQSLANVQNGKVTYMAPVTTAAIIGNLPALQGWVDNFIGFAPSQWVDILTYTGTDGDEGDCKDGNCTPHDPNEPPIPDDPPPTP